MKRVGIITYHSAYNFGSVLQALATQITIEDLGYETSIINYRMKSQRDFYSLIRKHYGIKTLAKDLMLIPYNRQRRVHNERFERVISGLKLTDEYVYPYDVDVCDGQFDCFVSGSDQIWNKNSCELTPVGWEYMNPYLLTFTNKRKLSYASSVANMTDEEINRILPCIEKFDYLSFREKKTAEKIGKRIGRSIDTVLDPTLLLNKENWAKEFNLEDEENKNSFILYYSLAGYRDVRPFLTKLTEISKKTNCKIIAITPFLAFMNTERISFVYDAGPLEFLRYIWNARLIITDSYHGTLFSINFNRPFFSITDGSVSHMRKSQILEELELTDRMAISPEHIRLTDNIDYKSVDTKIEDLQNKSLRYLKMSLS